MSVKYLVFAGDDYYPAGGAGDFIGAYDEPDEAVLKAPRNRDWMHVAELSRFGLVVVAERDNENDLKLYPERMAHRRTGDDSADGR